MKELVNLILPSWNEIFCTFLAFFIPFTLFNISEKLYEIGNPSWKREELKKQKEE